MHDLEHGETVVEREKFLKLVVPAAQRLLRSGQYGHVEWSLEQRAIFDHLGDGCPGRVDGVGDRFDLLLQSLALGGDGVEMRKLRLEMGLEACGFEWLVANRADRKRTRLNSRPYCETRMPASA